MQQESCSKCSNYQFASDVTNAKAQRFAAIVETATVQSVASDSATNAVSQCVVTATGVVLIASRSSAGSVVRQIHIDAATIVGNIIATDALPHVLGAKSLTANIIWGRVTPQISPNGIYTIAFRKCLDEDQYKERCESSGSQQKKRTRNNDGSPGTKKHLEAVLDEMFKVNNGRT